MKKLIHALNNIFRPVLITSLFLMSLLSANELNGQTINVTSVSEMESEANSASAGAIIVLADGTYNNNTFDISGSNITVRAETPGGVYLNGSNNITISGDYVTFSGFQFTSGSITGVMIDVLGSHNLITQCNWDGYSAKKYIVLEAGGQYNEVTYCNFENKPASATSGNLIHINPHATLPGYHLIKYCSFQNMPGNGGDFGNEPIRISNGATSTYVSRTTIEYCYWNNTGLADSESISVKCMENTIRYNTFTNQQDAMVVFRNGDDNKAYGNFFIGAGGIRVKEASNIDIYNNYFENSGTASESAVQYVYVSGNLDDITFTNNTFVNCPGVIDFDNGSPTNNTWANNIFDKASGDIFSGSTSGISFTGNIYQGTLGISIPSGMTNDDPELTLNSDGYYGLSSTSPCIDAGVSIPAIQDFTGVDDDPSLLLDISGQTRPSSANSKDIGCDEYTTGGITNRPLTLSDVGPDYLGPADTEAPSQVTGLSAVANGVSQIDLSWTAATDNVGVDHYAVYRDGGQTAVGTSAGTTFSDTGLSSSTNYSYTVAAADAAGNEGLKSTADNATTDAPDTEAPSQVTGLSAVANGGTQIDLSWTAATDNIGVDHYAVYRDGNPTAVVTSVSTSFNDTGLSAGTSYYYTVAAVDAAGNEGIESSSAAAVTANISETELSAHYFESGWDGWDDGGSDCSRYTSGTRSSEGSASIIIQDDSGAASTMTSPAYDLSSYDEVRIEWDYYAYSMESGEDFFLKYYDGSSWQTVATYLVGTDFTSDTFDAASVTLSSSSYTFPTNAQFSLECSASGNNDQIYIDEVIITGISNGGSSKYGSAKTLRTPEALATTENMFIYSVYPNPVSDGEVNIKINSLSVSPASLEIIGLDGRVYFSEELRLQEGQNHLKLDISRIKTKGLYLLRLVSMGKVITRRLSLK